MVPNCGSHCAWIWRRSCKRLIFFFSHFLCFLLLFYFFFDWCKTHFSPTFTMEDELSSHNIPFFFFSWFLLGLGSTLGFRITWYIVFICLIFYPLYLRKPWTIILFKLENLFSTGNKRQLEYLFWTNLYF